MFQEDVFHSEKYSIRTLPTLVVLKEMSIILAHQRQKIIRCANRMGLSRRLFTNYENLPMQYTEIFKFAKEKKMKNFTRKFLIIFLIFAQNIDCGYVHTIYAFGAKLRNNRYTPANPSLYIYGSIPGRGTTDFCTLILFVYIYIYIYIYI